MQPLFQLACNWVSKSSQTAVFACFLPNNKWGFEGAGGHNLLMQFPTLKSSKKLISKTDFFDILAIRNDQISYVKHVLDPLCVFFTLFVWTRLGGFSMIS